MNTYRRNKMIKYKNECADCPEEMGYLGVACPYINVPNYYYDNCGCERGV